MAFSASLALKLTFVINMVFGIGMCFFPDKLMEGYRADTFSGTGATFFQFAMGIFGIQQMYQAMINTSTSKNYIPQNVQSITCFCNMVIWAAFVLLDGRSLVGVIPLPAAVPRESIIANMVLFSAIAGANFLGWRSAGSVLPDLGALVPKGVAKVPLIAGLANLAFFGVGCGFFTEDFLEMFCPGVIASIDGSTNAAPMIYWILGNAGKVMLLNIVSTLVIAGVGDDKTSYRLLRLNVLVNMFYLGSVSREHIVFSAVGWPSPMYTMSFVQCFAVTFFMASRFGEVQLTLDDGSKKKK